MLTKIHLVKAMVFSSNHVWMWELDRKEIWAPKNWCFWIVVLEKTLESPLDCREIKLVHPKGNQSWIFIGRTEAEALIFWSPDVKSQLIGKNLDAGKDWREEEKGAAEDEMVKWHHWPNGCEFEQTLGDSGGQRSLGSFALHGVTKSWTWLSDWTTRSVFLCLFTCFLDSTCKWYQYLSSTDLSHLVSTIPSRSTHVVLKWQNLFFIDWVISKWL